MPDWPIFVKDRLGPLGLDAGREAEIVAELAGHYEDLSEEGMGGGLSEESVMSRAQGEVRDWKEFRGEIRRAELEEVTVKHRAKTIWLPGLITGAMTWFLYSLLESLGLQPRILVLSSPPLMFFLAWTLALPFIGALGAFGSRRAGGKPGEIALAGLFPALAMGAMFTALIPFSLVIERIMGNRVPLSVLLPAIGGTFLGWVIIPGAALAVGVMPFLLLRHRAPVAVQA